LHKLCADDPMKLGQLAHDRTNPARNGRLVRYTACYGTVQRDGKLLRIPRANLRTRSQPWLGRPRLGIGTGRESQLAAACGLTLRQVREALEQ